MIHASRQGLKRFYILSSLGILLALALTISVLFQHGYQKATQEHFAELRAEVLRSKHEFLRNAVERTIQIIDLERVRCASGRDANCDEKMVKARLHDYIRAIRLKDEGYIWVNAVRDYAGGDGYAYRFVHPNLPETEGTLLSTNMQDIKGNFPYRTELEGVKKDGEIFFDYWFKKMGSEVIQHKLTFAKLYKPFDWIVASGVYLDDVDELVQAGMARWEKHSRQNVLLAVAVTGLASLLAWLCSLLVGKRMETINAYFLGEVDQREKKLQRFTRELEAEVASRTRDIEISEDKYLDLYENAPDMYLSVEVASGLVEGCNRTLCRVLGYTREEILGRPVEELYHPDCLDELRQTFKRLVATGPIHDQELCLRKKDGSKLDVSLSIAAVYDESGALRSSRSTLRDIAERKRNDAINAARLHLMQFAAQHGMDELLEEALNEAEKLTGSCIGFYHLVNDDEQNLTLQAWSTRTKTEFCQATGVKMHSALSKAGVWGDCVHERKPVIHNDYAALPHRKGLPDGHPAVIRELVVPVLRDGKIRAILGVGNKLSDYQEKDVDTIQLLVDLVWEIVVRKQVEEERQKLTTELEQRVNERTAALQRKSTEVQNSQMALMNIVEDVNEKAAELKEANEKLLDLDRLKSMFIASMSHELRTPLNSIIGFSSILLNEWTGSLNAEQKENIASVLRSGKHLLSLINDVIDVSKIEAGKVESLSEEIDLNELVNEAVAAVSYEAGKKALEVGVQVEQFKLCSDRRRLLQCLLNLLSNAIKFTEQGSVNVWAGPTEDGSSVEIAVKDTGIGIHEEDLDKLFYPFVRLDSPLRAKILGTGLGLYLTQKLTTEVLRGEVSVSSVLGQGSRFVLRIPTSQATGETR